jgi:hypothetical protein
MSEVEVLKGQTIKSITGLEVGSDDVRIETEEGNNYTMTYYPDCCAQCDIADIIGDVEDLIGQKIEVAEERSQEADRDNCDIGYLESGTWTFYELRTIKGSVTIRWLGMSNGYYSESASFHKTGKGRWY